VILRRHPFETTTKDRALYLSGLKPFTLSCLKETIA
jgi:hypothetical protein